MSEEKSYLSAVVFDKTKVVILGGEDNNRNRLATVEQFDTINNQWTKLPSMPTPRSSLSAGVAGSHIIALGGQDDNTLVIWDVRNLLYYQIVLNRFKFYFFKYRLRAAKHLLEIQSA